MLALLFKLIPFLEKFNTLADFISLSWKTIKNLRKCNPLTSSGISVLEESISSTETFIPYKQTASKRLLESLEILNGENGKLSISKIAEYLEYISVSEIENYFHGINEPTNDFLERYSNYFGLQLEWLKHGNGHKFIRLNNYPTFPEWYKKDIDLLKPEVIIFIRSNGIYGESGIILQLTEHKFIILPRTYHLSSHVGGTGQNQIESFYDLIFQISCHYSSIQIQGRVIEKDEFDKLFCQELYPKTILKKYPQANYWWDDFLDIEHKQPIAKDYEAIYDTEFIKAQEIVRWKKGKIKGSE